MFSELTLSSTDRELPPKDRSYIGDLELVVERRGQEGVVKLGIVPPQPVSSGVRNGDVVFEQVAKQGVVLANQVCAERLFAHPELIPPDWPESLAFMGTQWVDDEEFFYFPFLQRGLNEAGVWTFHFRTMHVNFPHDGGVVIIK